MATNEFERDLDDQAGLKRPGRIDLRVFQNIGDAGDGHPGVQRCFRNYLHEGGMEKDLDLVGYSIKGTSVDINNAEMQQLSNIGAATISVTQWGYVGNMDQEIHKGHSPEFAGMTINGNITITGTVDTVDVGDLKTAFDALDYYTQAQVDAAVATKDSKEVSHAYVEATALVMENDITFNVGQLFDTKDVSGLCTQQEAHDFVEANALTLTEDLTMSGNNIIMAGAETVDGVDISVHAHSGAGHGGTVNHVNLSNKGSNTHANIDTHIDNSTIHISYPIKVNSADAKSTNTGSYTKLKETKIFSHETSITFYWEMSAASGGTAYSKLYKNGSPVGVEKSTSNDPYEAFSDTITVALNDLIQIYGYNNPGGGDNYFNVRNFYFNWKGGLFSDP